MEAIMYCTNCGGQDHKLSRCPWFKGVRIARMA